MNLHEELENMLAMLPDAKAKGDVWSRTSKRNIVNEYFEIIDKFRIKGYGYFTIAKILREKGVNINVSTLRGYYLKFCKKRAEVISLPVKVKKEITKPPESKEMETEIKPELQKLLKKKRIKSEPKKTKSETKPEPNETKSETKPEPNETKSETLEPKASNLENIENLLNFEKIRISVEPALKTNKEKTINDLLGGNK